MPCLAPRLLPPMLGLFIAFMPIDRSFVAAQGSDISKEKQQEAYRIAMKCAIANAVEDGIVNKSKNKEITLKYRAMAERSLDTAFGLGRKLGLSNESIKNEFESMQKNEILRMIKVEQYFNDIILSCRALNLIK